MGCTFCATGTMGIKGELTAGEIVEQLVHARKLSSIRNVVFMGMGVRAPALRPPLPPHVNMPPGPARPRMCRGDHAGGLSIVTSTVLETYLYWRIYICIDRNPKFLDMISVWHNPSSAYGDVRALLGLPVGSVRAALVSDCLQLHVGI